VLRRKDVGEADRFVVAFTRAVGKVLLIAKGVRRPISRMSGHLELGRSCRIQIVERRSWSLITQAETIKTYMSADADLQEVRDTLALLEVVDHIIDVNQRDSRVYDLLVAALEAYQGADSARRNLIAGSFTLRALALVGYQAELGTCIKCNKEIEDVQDAVFNASRGGLVHKGCGLVGPGSFGLSLAATKLLKRMAVTDFGLLAGEVHSAELISEVDRPVRAFVEWTSEKQLKTAKLLVLPT